MKLKLSTLLSLALTFCSPVSATEFEIIETNGSTFLFEKTTGKVWTLATFTTYDKSNLH